MSSSAPSSSSSGGGRRRRGGGDFDGPSSSRRRATNEVWPEPFIEALATQVAIDASRSLGRIHAAAALSNVFQVCSTWRAVSRSELLWHRLTTQIWGRTDRLLDTWRDEYVYWHTTACNFRTHRSLHTVLQFDQSDVDEPDSLMCRCLAISLRHLACGFADGTIRLFDLATRVHVTTFRPHHRDRLGQFSRAVSGIVIADARIVFASIDGDIHIGVIDRTPAAISPTRRVHEGNVMNDGVLVDFAGCDRWWVGLYAGVPGRAFHIWDGNSEELVFVGGSLTDPESVTGWHMLAEPMEQVGRVRVSSRESAVACTSLQLMVLDLRNQEVVLNEEENGVVWMVTSMDVSNETYIVVDGHGVAVVRRVGTMEEVCTFTVTGAAQRGAVGCMNMGYAVMSSGGAIRVWEIEHGQYLYRFRERIGAANAVIANDRYVAASGFDTTLHLWDFGA
ncbi:transcriptional regulator STERILE APETALA [Cucurbita maxima]|uniref:Transcriptional regulator STERILE APETALA n=1 Tax=Cucurbita maxima TaxID=3661 RepID=A0A6J1JEA1_CUCMA|nr:transcriptional regulator STERILE APETALA [Cucurbita maxima]